jgi:hypothetical protein
VPKHLTAYFETRTRKEKEASTTLNLLLNAFGDMTEKIWDRYFQSTKDGDNHRPRRINWESTELMPGVPIAASHGY